MHLDRPIFQRVCVRQCHITWHNVFVTIEHSYLLYLNNLAVYKNFSQIIPVRILIFSNMRASGVLYWIFFIFETIIPCFQKDNSIFQYSTTPYSELWRWKICMTMFYLYSLYYNQFSNVKFWLWDHWIVHWIVHFFCSHSQWRGSQWVSNILYFFVLTPGLKIFGVQAILKLHPW